ncbi:EboA domain-containing protein [Salinicola avicenniae]|uniref:EboA domain-containing protein n=1 Tax=Salinicola avicenniae TaxID=2916836 RepID=UPI00207375F8|nr:MULTISPECIES: EboA domain-containing protein [unclassified Salinicola]
MAVSPLELLHEWVARQAGEQTAWFERELSILAEGGAAESTLHRFLGWVPRRLGRADLTLTSADLARAAQARRGWNPSGWSLDGAARVAGLLAFQGERDFSAIFRDLVRTADARELITLYRGLPLYPAPETLSFEVGEGLRSNMHGVFEAIAHANPYPQDHFDDHRFNHMVLKALFIGSRLGPIVGLEARANVELAGILLDHVKEREAAGRAIDPELWRCIGPFAQDVGAYAALADALAGAPDERAAATLALMMAVDTPETRELLDRVPEMRRRAIHGEIDWNHLTCDEVA